MGLWVLGLAVSRMQDAQVKKSLIWGGGFWGGVNATFFLIRVDTLQHMRKIFSHVGEQTLN